MQDRINETMITVCDMSFSLTTVSLTVGNPSGTFVTWHLVALTVPRSPFVLYCASPETDPPQRALPIPTQPPKSGLQDWDQTGFQPNFKYSSVQAPSMVKGLVIDNMNFDH